MKLLQSKVLSYLTKYQSSNRQVPKNLKKYTLTSFIYLTYYKNIRPHLHVNHYTTFIQTGQISHPLPIFTMVAIIRSHHQITIITAVSDRNPYGVLCTSLHGYQDTIHHVCFLFCCQNFV